MLALFTYEWAGLAVATLAATFNLYAMQAEKGQYPMGLYFWKYRMIIELLNWIVLLGIIVFLSYHYSWYILLLFWVFPVLGSAIASILKGLTQLAYLFVMPILAIASILRLTWGEGR